MDPNSYFVGEKMEVVPLTTPHQSLFWCSAMSLIIGDDALVYAGPEKYYVFKKRKGK